MRIDGSGNFIAQHIARAYGVPKAAAPASTSPVGRIAPSPGAAPASGTPIASTTNASAQSLIAGRVPGPIAFDGVSVPRATPGVLNLYTRAADKIEAAIAVQIGRTIDIKG